MSTDKVVTFSCQSTISVYTNDSQVKPIPPYKTHNSVKDAIEYMESVRGIKNPKIRNV